MGGFVKADLRGSFPASSVEYMKNGGQKNGWKWLWISYDQFYGHLFLFFCNKADKEEK